MHGAEHFLKADTSWIFRSDCNGNSVHIVLKDGTGIVFRNITDFFNYHANGEQVDRVYIPEEALERILKGNAYSFEDFEYAWEQIKSTEIDGE